MIRLPAGSEIAPLGSICYTAQEWNNIQHGQLSPNLRSAGARIASAARAQGETIVSRCTQPDLGRRAAPRPGG
jgi:hypothetical protein